MKRHYLALDGLRGVAAITVVAHHFQKAWGVPDDFLRAGYLSVDFFFALSGFVIAAAYEGKFADGMKFWAFMGVRTLRLYPMMFLGALIGLACALILGDTSNLPLGIVSQVLLIPGLSGAGMLFQLNGVYWSLFFEVCANIAHKLLFRWSSLPVLVTGVALSAVVAVVSAWKLGHFGGGWGPSNWWCGFVRVALSYAIGVLIFRLHKVGRLPSFTAPFPVLALLFVGAILAASVSRAWWADLIPVFLVFPPLLIAGVNAKQGRSAATVAVLGQVSYPLYATHGPLALLWGAYAPHTLLSAVVAGVAMVAAAFAMDRWYDTPVRAFIASKTRPPAPPQATPAPSNAAS